MEVRPAETDDCSRIQTLARDSFRSSYSLSPQEIEIIVENEFGSEVLSDRLDDEDVTVLVAEHTSGDTEDVQGFIDVSTADEPVIRWLHVDPEARGQGIATALLERWEESGEGTSLSARVMEDAVEGGEFLEKFGLEKDGDDELTVEGEEFAVAVFTRGSGTVDSNEPSVSIPESVPVDGTDRPVDEDEQIPGRNAPFFVIYSGEDRSEPYGYLCSDCGSTDVAADGLDRVECSDCGNLHLADEWDNSYL